MDTSPLPEPGPTAEAETAIVISPEWFGVEKLGHIILFAALAFSAATAFPERHWTAAAGGLALVAITSEVLQLLGDARFPGAIDILWDGVGIGAGLAIQGAWLRGVLNRRRGA